MLDGWPDVGQRVVDAMSVAPFEIPQSWRRPGCSELCWQRFVLIEAGRRRQALTYHDLDSHEQAWNAQQEEIVVETGPLVVNGWRHLASVDGIDVLMTRTEFKILHYLARHVGQLCPAEAILMAVWGDVYRLDSHLLRVNISRLRAHLRCAHLLIVNHPGSGYELRKLDACRSDSIPPSILTRLPKRINPTAILGFRQRRLLAALRATPDGLLTIKRTLTSVWGNCSESTSQMLSAAVKRLQLRGYPIVLKRTPEPFGGSVWLTGECPS